MKTFTHILKKSLGAILSSISLGTIVFATLVVGIAVYYVHLSTSKFESEYATYAKLAHDNDAMVFLVGAENNPTRQDLNTILSQVLTSDISSAKRIEMSKNGLDLLKELEKQINDVGDQAERVSVALVKMDLAANGASDFSDKTGMRSIVALGKHRADITQDIRGLSYRANFETAQVFHRIIDDGGRLTQQHIKDLNDSLPALTDEFDKRTRLYTSLENIARQIDEQYSSI